MAGTARLEFAVSVAVLGVVGAFALNHIAELQAAAQIAQVQTKAAQARSVTALDRARCAPPAAASAALPDPDPFTATASSTPIPTQAPQTDTALQVDSPVPSCP